MKTKAIQSSRSHSDCRGNERHCQSILPLPLYGRPEDSIVRYTVTKSTGKNGSKPVGYVGTVSLATYAKWAQEEVENR